MNIPTIIDYLQRKLARSKFAVKLAVLLRNQCRCVIKYSLTESPNFILNGEAWLLNLIAPKSLTFIDVGANLGEWSSLFLESMPQGGKGLLFEPSDYAIDCLKKRFDQVEQIEVIQAAVSDKPGQMFFFEEPEAGHTSSLVAGLSNSMAIQKNVTVTTIDDEVEQRQWRHIDFLKIDAEGYDLHIMRGCSRLLAKQQISVIQFEYGGAWALAGSTLAGAFNLLDSFGYKTFLLKSQGIYELNYKRYEEFFAYANFVAVAPNKMLDMQPFLKGIV